jgi:hypothetical protein
MTALAERFPGALREIDDLPLADIRARITALASALRDPAQVLPWMVAIARFHALTRGALCAKRWLSSRATPAEREDLVSYEADMRACRFPEEAIAWSGQLARIADPPRGRITDLVFERLADELGMPIDDARRLVFGEGRRKRGASG